MLWAARTAIIGSEHLHWNYKRGQSIHTDPSSCAKHEKRDKKTGEIEYNPDILIEQNALCLYIITEKKRLPSGCITYIFIISNISHDESILD